MSYLDMRPVPLRDFVVEFESLRSSSAAEFGSNEVGQEFEPRGLMRRSQFYSSPLLPHVWFEPVLVRRQMTAQEIADRRPFFDALMAERRTDTILISFLVFVLFFLICFSCLYFLELLHFVILCKGKYFMCVWSIYFA